MRERNLIRKDLSLELVKESSQEVTNENRRMSEERGAFRTQIEQLSKELSQVTQKLHACISEN